MINLNEGCFCQSNQYIVLSYTECYTNSQECLEAIADAGYAEFEELLAKALKEVELTEAQRFVRNVINILSIF